MEDLQRGDTVVSHLEMSLIEINLNCFSYSLTCYL